MPAGSVVGPHEIDFAALGRDCGLARSAGRRAAALAARRQRLFAGIVGQRGIARNPGRVVFDCKRVVARAIKDRLSVLGRDKEREHRPCAKAHGVLPELVAVRPSYRYRDVFPGTPSSQHAVQDHRAVVLAHRQVREFRRCKLDRVGDFRLCCALAVFVRRDYPVVAFAGFP